MSIGTWGAVLHRVRPRRKQRAAQGHPAKAGSDPCGLPSGPGLVHSPPCVAAEGCLPTCFPAGSKLDSRNLSAKWGAPPGLLNSLCEKDGEAQRRPEGPKVTQHEPWSSCLHCSLAAGTFKTLLELQPCTWAPRP